MSIFQSLLSPKDNTATRIVNGHPEGPRRCHIYPKPGQSFVHLRPEFIYKEFGIKLEDLTYIHHLETNDRIKFSRHGVMLPAGGTFVLKDTPFPRSRHSRIAWTCLLLVLLVLAILDYNQTTFSADWNGDAFDSTMGNRFGQGANIELSLPLYFFPWEKIMSLRSRYIKWVFVWGFGYVLHSIIVIYYVITIFWIEIPLPSVAVDNALLFYSVAVTIISVWLD